MSQLVTDQKVREDIENFRNSIDLKVTEKHGKIIEGTDLKPGILVKFKDLKNKTELNGKVGIVDSQRLNNDRVPIRFGGRTTCAFKPEHVDYFHQCPQKTYDTNTPFMIYPKIKSVLLPSVMAVEDRVLLENFTYTKKEAEHHDYAELGIRLCHLTDRSLLLDICDDTKQAIFLNRLKELFGWKKPMLKIIHRGDPQEPLASKEQSDSHYFFHDAESKAPVNYWFDTINLKQGYTIRGPFVLVLKGLNQGKSDHNINKVKAHFHNYMEESVPESSPYTDDMSVKKVLYMKWKRVNQIISTNTCPREFNCEACERSVQNLKIKEEEVSEMMKKMSDKNKNCTKREAKELVIRLRAEVLACTMYKINHASWTLTTILKCLKNQYNPPYMKFEFQDQNDMKSAALRLMVSGITPLNDDDFNFMKNTVESMLKFKA